MICIFVVFFTAGLLSTQLGDRFFGKGAFQSIQASGHGHFYLVATKGGYQAWIMKLDQNLNTIWEKSSYGPGGERLTGSHLLIDSNRNLIVSGQASISSRNYGWAMKMDKNGQILWNKL